jgi:transcriptional regulator with XRE-family HTH domain
MTQTLLAQTLGVSRQTVADWKRNGVDMNDMEALRAKADASKKRRETTPDIAAAKLRKTLAEADRQELAAARERGTLTPSAEVFGHGEALGLAVRAALERLAADLPPTLAGRPASEISAVLQREHRAVLQKLADTVPARYLQQLNKSSK